MKTALTTEQSAALIDRGIPEEKASQVKEWRDDVSQWTHRGTPIFTLTDLFGLLPKQIDGACINVTGHIERHFLHIDCSADVCMCYYKSKSGVLDLCVRPELIDALYELLFWLIDNRALYKIDFTK